MGLFTAPGTFMAMQFEKRPEGYWYRVNGKGPAWPVTEQEYAGFVRRAGISFVLGVAATLTAIIAAAMLISLWFPQGDEPGGLVLLGVALVTIGFGLYRAQHWEMRAPERALAGRTPIDLPPPPEPPRRTPRTVARDAQPTGGRLAYFGYAVAEIVGSIAAMLIAFRLLEGFGETVAVGGGLIAAVVVAWLIERQCIRHTGTGVLSELPLIP